MCLETGKSGQYFVTRSIFRNTDGQYFVTRSIFRNTGFTDFVTHVFAYSGDNTRCIWQRREMSRAAEPTAEQAATSTAEQAAKQAAEEAALPLQRVLRSELQVNV